MTGVQTCALPISFTIMIDEGERPGDGEKVLNLILPFLYRMGYGWGRTRRSKQTPIDFIEELDDKADAGYQFNLQVNYERLEPFTLSYNGEEDPDWTFTPKQFMDKYMKISFDTEVIFNMLNQ